PIPSWISGGGRKTFYLAAKVASLVVGVSIPGRHGQTRPSRLPLWAVALGAVLALGGAVLAAHPASAVILDNGSVMIGIATDAELNDAGTMPSCGTGTYNVGIRF